MIKVIEEIKEMEHRLVEAMLDSNINELDHLISNEIIFTDHQGQLIDKETDLEAHRSGMVNVENIEIGEQKIQVHSNVVVVSSLMSINGQYAGQAFSGKNRYTRLWMKEKESWKIKAGHASTVV